MQAMNRKIGIGVVWNLAGLVLNTGASTIVTLVLARILVPQAFGLIAMITVFFELAGALINSGFSQALIRAKTVEQRDLSTVFYANMALSLVVYTTLFVCAPFVADFYDQSELVMLIRVTGVVVLLNAFRIVQTAVLSRAMNFGAQTRANVSGVVVSGAAATAMAWWGMGVWSLVAQMVTASTVSAAMLWFASPWRPSLVFSPESFRPLFAFARSLMLEGILFALYRNAYPIVIGRFFSVEAAGLYFLAAKLNNFIAPVLTSAVQKASFPALSNFQDEDEILREKYRQILSLVLFAVSPAILLTAVVAEPLFVSLFGEKWRQAALYFQLLSAVGVLYPLNGLNVNIMYVKGRSDLVLKSGVLKMSIDLSFLFLAIPWGVIGIVCGQIAGAFLALILNSWFAARLIDYTFLDQAKDALRPIGAAVLAALIAWSVLDALPLNPLPAIAVAWTAGGLAYLALSHLARAQGFTILISIIQRGLSGLRGLPS
jgi:O-antigen/teichoic acid export membrane protein